MAKMATKTTDEKFATVAREGIAALCPYQIIEPPSHREASHSCQEMMVDRASPALRQPLEFSNPRFRNIHDSWLREKFRQFLQIRHFLGILIGNFFLQHIHKPLPLQRLQ
jgi:hypothetical protein